MKFFFPDVNVWIALTYRAHVHHRVASEWFDGIGSDQVFFCRFTQLGFLRLLTNSHVMGNQVRSQKEAWRVYDRWFSDARIAFHPEPSNLDPFFRRFTQSSQPATSAWPDAYLAAVARARGLTVVTMDAGFRRMDDLDVVVLARVIKDRSRI